MLDTQISKVPGLEDGDRTVLIGHELPSTQAIWKALAAQQDLISTLGLNAAAVTRVRAALAAQGKKEAAAITRNWLVAHLADVLVLGVTVAVVLGLGLVHHRRAVREARPLMVAARPIAPFHVIDASDLKARHALSDATLKQAEGQYIGRYPTVEVGADERLDLAPLSSGGRLRRELNGLHIFTIKIRATALLAGMRPPYQLDLFLPPRSPDERAKAQMVAVYVLDLKPEADSLAAAVVAASADDSTTLLSSPATGGLIAVGPVR